MGTFAIAAVVVRGYRFFFQKIFNHFYDLTVIIVAEVERKVPCIVKGDWFIIAFATDHFRKYLACKIVTYYWILSLFVVIPPLLTLDYDMFTIYWSLFLLRSAFSSLYFGFFDRFSSKLSNSNNAKRNYCASCWP